MCPPCLLQVSVCVASSVFRFDRCNFGYYWARNWGRKLVHDLLVLYLIHRFRDHFPGSVIGSVVYVFVVCGRMPKFQGRGGSFLCVHNMVLSMVGDAAKVEGQFSNHGYFMSVIQSLCQRCMSMIPAFHATALFLPLPLRTWQWWVSVWHECQPEHWITFDSCSHCMFSRYAGC